MEIKEILAKEQFNQKLGLKYFVASGHFLSIAALFYLFDLEATTSLIFLLATSLLTYKYLFNYTTNGNQGEPLLLKLLGIVLTKIRHKAMRHKNLKNLC